MDEEDRERRADATASARSSSARSSESSAASATDVPLDVVPLHSTNLLTVLDPDGVVRYESPAIERIFGFEQDDLVSESVASYFHPDDRERVVAAFRTVVECEGSTIESVEYRHERADGRYCWVESVASSDPTPGGYYVVNTRDVSDRRAREAALERTNDRLEEFASVVSHDLRNPLNVAVGQTRLALEDSDSDHLDAVVRAHDRMAELIDDLLALARVGDRIDEVEPVDVAALAADCWRTVASGETRLVTEFDRRILADSARCRQLLENLLGNAVEHGPADVTITVGERADGTGFYVADDGPGIPRERRERVFESGSRRARAAPASGWPSSPTSSTPTGGRSRSARATRAVPASTSRASSSCPRLTTMAGTEPTRSPSFSPPTESTRYLHTSGPA